MLKTLLSFAFATAVAVSSQAQEGGTSSEQHSIKIPVLIEEFTNSGCGPCAEYAPVLDSAVSYRLGEVVAVKYHGVYPDRNDPYYLAQKDNFDKRILFYDVMGYPTTVLNGIETLGGAMKKEMLDAYLDHYTTEAMKPQDVDYGLSITSITKDGTVDVKAEAKPGKDVQNPNLRLFVCLVEEYCELPEALKNGEKELRYTVRQMFPDGDGHDFGPSLKAGQAYDYSFTASTSDFADARQLGIVAFLQDMQTKRVVASSYIPRMASGSNNVVVMNLENTPDNICLPDYYGRVMFRNLGANALTSATVNVSVNGTVKTYPWTGNLAYLAKDTLSFSGFDSFQLNQATNKNDVEVWLSDINGTDSRSNSFITSFSNSVQAEEGVELKLYTDNKPGETTWKLYNSAGDVVAQGGPYAEARHFYTTRLDIQHDDCYLLEFSDSGKDGIAGDNGNGFYQLYQVKNDGKRTRIAQGDYRTASFDLAFRLVNAATGIGEAIHAETSGKVVGVADLSGRSLGNLKHGSAKHGRHGVVLVTTRNSDGTESTRKVAY